MGLKITNNEVIMKYMEQAIKKIEEILKNKQILTKGDKFLIKTVLKDLLEENKKLKEQQK